MFNIKWLKRIQLIIINLQFIIIILNVYLFLYISSTEKWRGNHLNHQSMKYFKSVHNSYLIKYNILKSRFYKTPLMRRTAFIFLFSLCFCSSILCISVFTSIIHCNSRTFWHRLMLNKPQMVHIYMRWRMKGTTCQMRGYLQWFFSEVNILSYFIKQMWCHSGDGLSLSLYL